MLSDHLLLFIFLLFGLENKMEHNKREKERLEKAYRIVKARCWVLGILDSIFIWLPLPNWKYFIVILFFGLLWVETQSFKLANLNYAFGWYKKNEPIFWKI